jgi:hypothetical protein
LQQISHGQLTARKFSHYDIQGYRFRTARLEANRPLASTRNSGVVASTVNNDGDTDDYYGVLQDITEYTFGGRKPLKIVTFDCIWFDPIAGTRVIEHDTVEVKHASRYKGNEYNNIVLAHQAKQVYYMSHPHPSFKNWWVVSRVTPEINPHQYDNYNIGIQDDENVDVYQEDGEGESEEEFRVSDGIGLENELASLVVELISEEPGTSNNKTVRKSQRLIERERLNTRVAQEESDADDF